MAAQEQSLLNVQKNLFGSMVNVQNNLVKGVEDVQANILNKLNSMVQVESNETPLFVTKPLYKTKEKKWVENDGATIFSPLDHYIRDFMLWNTDEPEKIVRTEPTAPLGDMNDYITYLLLEIDKSKHTEEYINSCLDHVKNTWMEIVNEVKTDPNSGYKYHVNKVIQNGTEVDKDKLNIYLTLVSKNELSDSAKSKIETLPILNKVKFIFKIVSSNDAIIYALGNSPYGGGNTSVLDSKVSIQNYTYIFKEEVALKLQLLDSAVQHGAWFLSTHNYQNTPPFMTRDGQRPKTNLVDCIGTYHSFIGEDNEKYVCYACFCMYNEDIVNGITNHAVHSSPTSTLEIKYKGELPSSRKASETCIFTGLFNVWFHPKAEDAVGKSAINILTEETIFPDLNIYKYFDKSGLKVTKQLETLWNNYPKDNFVLPTDAQYVKSPQGIGITETFAVSAFFYTISEEDEITYQILSFLSSSDPTFTGEYSVLNNVTGKNATRENLVANGLVTVSLIIKLNY